MRIIDAYSFESPYYNPQPLRSASTCLVVTVQWVICASYVLFSGACGGLVVKATNRQVVGSIPDGVIGIFQ